MKTTQCIFADEKSGSVYLQEDRVSLFERNPERLFFFSPLVKFGWRSNEMPLFPSEILVQANKEIHS